jgi:L-amino acid N-acyltransferase YncA
MFPSGKGLGRLLLNEIISYARAEENIHVLIGGIDSTNTASIRLHTSAGFKHSGTIQQAGYKFNKWLDLCFYQLILDTPKHPSSK